MDVIDVDIRSFSYKGEDLAALKNVRFSVERGELVVLTGNSGCGKTTLLRAMNGLIPDQYEGELDGRIELLGKSLGEFSSGELARPSAHLPVGTSAASPLSAGFPSSTRSS